MLISGDFIMFDLPLGFGMALAQNSEALEIFSKMDKTQKDKVLMRVQNVNSKDEMQDIVRDLTQNIIM